MPDPNVSMSLAAVVARIIREVFASVAPTILGEVKRKLADERVPMDAATEELIRLQLSSLHEAARGIVDEWQRAEARGKAHPLGGDAIEWERVEEMPTKKGG